MSDITKVGLVTFYSDNYGSCLQAFALYHMIKDMGYEPTLISYSRSTDGGGHSSLLSKVKHHSLKTILSGLLSYRMIQGKKKAFSYFRKNQFVFTDKTYCYLDDETGLNDEFDVFVCGSDMMWCEVFQNDWGHHFLRFAKNNKRVSYAPSFGINSISDSNFKCCKEYLSGFRQSCLSCRDLSGVEMIKEKFGLSAHHVVDPTMLYSKAQWGNFVIKERMLKRPYVLLYLFGGQIGGRKRIIKQVKEWGIGDIKAICNNGKYHIHNPHIGPFEYVRLFRDAEFVITDTFHGLMFSLIFEKPFVVLTRNDGQHWAKYSDRMTAQLDMLGIIERYHDSDRVLPDSFRNLDYTNISKKIEELRGQSVEYLHNALIEADSFPKI